MLLGIKWHQFVRNDQVQRLTGQPKLTAIVQSRRLTLFEHIARTDDSTDAKRVYHSPSRGLEETSRTPPHHMTQHHTAGSDISQSHTARSNGYGPELVSMEDVVDVWRYTILSCRPETTTTTTLLLKVADVPAKRDAQEQFCLPAATSDSYGY